MANLENIKVGDRVWLSAEYGGSERGTIKPVVRLTPTQIILGGGDKKYNTYQRGAKSRFGDDLNYHGIGRASGRITFIATPEECAKWDADIERGRLETEARKIAANAAEAKREELTALFPASQDDNRGTYVREASYGDRKFRADKYDVTFHSLTEAEVRILAEKVAVMPTSFGKVKP